MSDIKDKVSNAAHAVADAAKGDSPDGQHHFIPTSWVGRVHEDHVHLTKNSVETEGGWKSDAASCANCR